MHHPQHMRKSRFSYGTYGYGLLRIGVGLEVLALTWQMATGLDQVAGALASWGFPSPHLLLLLSIGAGLMGGLALLLGVRVRLAVAGLGALFLPTTSVLLALYTGNAWGEWQWLLQVGRLAEVPFMMGFFVWALAAGAGSFSLGNRQARQSARQAQGAAVVEAEPAALQNGPFAAGRPASTDRGKDRAEQRAKREPRSAVLASCCS